MTAHERRGMSVEWFTPQWVFDAIPLAFDMDPFIRGQNAATVKWAGNVWANPPYGQAGKIGLWVRLFIEHGQGIMLVPARTDTGWCQQLLFNSDLCLFPRGRIKFIPADGQTESSPAFPSLFCAIGLNCANALRESKIEGVRALSGEPQK